MVVTKELLKSRRPGLLYPDRLTEGRLLYACDLDDVLGNMREQFVRFHNDNYGTNLRVEDLTDYATWRIVRCTREEMNRRFRSFYGSSYFRLIQPEDGAVLGVEYLAEDADLIVATSRPEYIGDQTRDWIERFFPEKFAGVFLTEQEHVPHTKNKKIALFREFDVDLVIEDASQAVNQCVKAEIDVVYLDRPWNQKRILKPAKRCYSWIDGSDEANRPSIVGTISPRQLELGRC